MQPRFRTLRTAFGWAGFVVGPRGLMRVYIAEQSRGALLRAIARDMPGARHDRRLLPGLAGSLERYFSGDRVEPVAELDETIGTDFERRVWRACRGIGYGRRWTYKQLAEAAGRPRAARAVGLALGRNPRPIVVPCHRVVRSDGHLGGFSAPGGVSLKATLLDLEISHAAANGARA